MEKHRHAFRCKLLTRFLLKYAWKKGLEISDILLKITYQMGYSTLSWQRISCGSKYPMPSTPATTTNNNKKSFQYNGKTTSVSYSHNIIELEAVCCGKILFDVFSVGFLLLNSAPSSISHFSRGRGKRRPESITWGSLPSDLQRMNTVTLRETQGLNFIYVVYCEISGDIF